MYVLGEIETAVRRTRIYLDSGTVLVRDPAAEDTAPDLDELRQRIIAQLARLAPGVPGLSADDLAVALGVHRAPVRMQLNAMWQAGEVRPYHDEHEITYEAPDHWAYQPDSLWKLVTE